MSCAKQPSTQATRNRPKTTLELEMNIMTPGFQLESNATWSDRRILSSTMRQPPSEKIQGFALENEVPGSYLVQGFAAGIIGGFVYANVMVLGTGESPLLLTVKLMLLGGFVSATVAILLRLLAK